jgi:lipoprotein-releasing system ATP-binding protein
MLASGLQLNSVSKNYGALEILQPTTFTLEPGSSLAVTGPSGSGKTTLLHLIGTLDTPSSGTLLINGTDPFALAETPLARFRNQHIGFVFQDHHLLPQYSVLENVLMPTLAFKERDADAPQRALELLQRVGLAHRLTHRPAALSGGERQRVAVARALINRPALLLCDEPTGNLDPTTAAAIGALLFELQRQDGTMLIGVTHNLDLAARFKRRFELKEGVCVEV